MDPIGDQPQELHLQSQLAELLECERELDRLLGAAREEARQKVDEARAAAEKAATEMEAALAEEASRLRSTTQRQSRSRVEEILDRSRERATRFEGTSDAQIEALADSAFQRLIASDERS